MTSPLPLTSSVSSLDDSRSLQDEHLASMGLYRFKIPEDGNCMFRAVASQLRLDQEKYHLVLRQAAAAWMGQHAQQLLAAGLLDGVGEIMDAAREGSWPGQAALVALSNVLRVNIAVVQGGDQGKVDIQHVTPYEDVQADADSNGVLLAYLYNGHYDAVVHEPNVPNPDYALWSAEKHYSDAVSEAVARKLSEESGLPQGIYNILQSDTEKSVSVSSDQWSDHSMHSDDRSRGFEQYSPKHGDKVDKAKVSCMKIDLKPVQNHASGSGSYGSKPPQSFRKDLPNGDIDLSRRREGRRPSVENIKSEMVSEGRHSVLRPSKSADVSRSARGDHRPPAGHNSRGGSVQRNERSQSESRSNEGYNLLNSRRSSSPGPRSPYTYISAAVEKEMRKRKQERKLSHGSALPYTYDSTSRMFGVGKQSRDASLERPHTTRQSSEPGNYYNVTGDNSRGQSPQKVYSKYNLKKVPTDRKSSWPTSTQSTQKKSFGVDLRSSREKEKELQSDKEKAEEILKQNFGKTYKLKPIKQNSLSKDFGRHDQAEAQAILSSIKERRSSEGTKHIKKDKVVVRPAKPDFGLDLGSPRKIHIDTTSKAVPKTMPKPQIVDRETLMGILASESQKSEDRNGRRASQDSRSSRSSQKDKKIIVIPISVKSSSHERSSERSDSGSQESPTRTQESPSRRERRDSRSNRYRDQESFPGFTKTRVRSRERRRSRDHTNDGSQPTIRVRKPSSSEPDFDTITTVTTPDEPTKSASRGMPYVGLSPSETRKVHVQVSTEDLEVATQTARVNEPLKLYSPQLVRQDNTTVSPGSTSTNGLYGIGTCQSPVSPLTPLSPRSDHSQSLNASPTRQLLSPSPGPGIRRVLPSPTKGLVEIPLRPSPEPNSQQQNQYQQQHQEPQYQQQQPLTSQGLPPRRRSVVEIQPQPLQTQVVSQPRDAGRSSVQIPITHVKSADNKNFEVQQKKYGSGMVNGTGPQQAPVSMDFVKSFRSPQKVELGQQKNAYM